MNFNHLISKIMKTRILSILFIMGISSFTVFAGNNTEKFKVAGNCGMCEARIEKAAKSIAGVSSADWNPETDMIEVSYNAETTDINAIHKAIADSGHDTDKCSAKDDVYSKLPGCCKYERLSNDKDSSCCEDAQSSCGGHNH